MAQSQDGGRYVRPAKLDGDPSGEYQPLLVDAQGRLLVAGTSTGGSTGTVGSDVDVIDRAARLLGRVTVDSPLALEATLQAVRARLEGTLDVATGLAQPLTDSQLGARGLATDAALVPLLDSVEALLGQVRDRLPPTAPAQPLTDTQLRAAPVLVDTGLSAAGPLALESTQAAVLAAVDTLELLTGQVRDRLPATAHTQPLTAAQAITTPVRVREGLAYYSSVDGGQVAFNTTTDIMTIPSTGEQPLAAISNPTGSGVDFLLWYGEFSTSANADLRRYRGATVTANGQASQSWANMGGGTATNPVLFYRGGTINGVAATYTATGGTVSKTAQIGARIHYPAEEHFAVRIRPGQATRWTIVGPGGIGGQFTAAIYLAGAIVPTGT